MYCPRCGHGNDDQARFCVRCGQSLKGISRESAIQETIATGTGVLYAGFWRRLGAALIDGIISTVAAYAVLFIVATIFGTSVGWEDPSTGQDIAMLILIWMLWIAIPWIYWAAMESSAMQATPGKMAVGIVVTDLEGRKLSFRQASGRYFGKFISAIIFYIGFFMIAFTEKKQGLHDKMAGCLVVKR